MKHYDCAILYHNYYSRQGLADVKERIRKLTGYKILLLASMSDKFPPGPDTLNSEDEKYLFSPNQGKDIGGKLLLMSLYLKLRKIAPCMIFLHDKQSRHKYSGTFEKQKLFNILSPQTFSLAFQLLSKNPEIGIICQKGFIKNEYDRSTGQLMTTNSAFLKELQVRYDIKTKDHSFVAGTMFCARTSALSDFFSQHNPAAIRATLEKGNVLDDSFGTVTHSWERLLCWILTSEGFKIKEVEC